MGRRRRLLAAGLVAVCLLPAAGLAQPPQAASAPAPNGLPSDLLALLDTVDDFTYDFDHPAYYALLEFVQHATFAPDSTRAATVVDDWRELLERPADFRGRLITIEGLIARNKDPYTHPRYPRLGQVWQVELHRPDQAISCTVIFTNDVSDLPLGATIRLTGYFLKINRYPTQTARPGLAALLVAPGPTELSRPLPPHPAHEGLDWRWMTGAIIAALIVTVLLLRRARRAERHDPQSLRARHAAPMSLADDLAEWAERDRPDRDHHNDA